MTHLIEVGRTRDACDGDNGVRFVGEAGDVTVAAGKGVLAELPAITNELIWYCAGTRERAANDPPFNWVLCDRAGNGAIQWVFYFRWTE